MQLHAGAFNPAPEEEESTSNAEGGFVTICKMQIAAK
jgi:hypothetical protein